MRGFWAVIAAGLALLAPLAAAPAVGQSAAVVAYSGWREPLMLSLLERFRRETGVQVTVRSGAIGQLANLVLEERGKPRADVIISNEVSVLEVLRREGVLEPYLGAAVARIPAAYRAQDGTWIGLSARAHVLMVNRDRLAWSHLRAPASMLDLVNEQWRARIVMPAYTNEYIVGWLSALRQLRGDQWTELFFARLRDVRPVLVAGGTQVREAIARGEAAVGVANHYDYHLQVAEGTKNIDIIYPDQGPDGMGVLFSPTGIGIVKGGPNPSGARRLADFLAADRRAQEFYATSNFEYPLLEGVPLHQTVRPLAKFTRMNVSYQQLGELRESTLKLVREGVLR